MLILSVKNHYSRNDQPKLYSDTELQRLDMPVYLILGEEDPLFTSEKIAQRLEQLCENIKINMLKGTGHVITKQSESMLEFLKHRAKASSVSEIA